MRARIGIAPNLVMTATSGADTAKPTTPPADRMAFSPADSSGVPDATCTRPRTPTSSAVQPMTIRAVSALLSGWRKKRQASSASKTGMVQVPDPNSVTSAVARGLIGPLACHQEAAAAMIAAHNAASPRPSRRCSGSRSRALRPRARERVPTVCASAIQIAATAVATQPARITNGLVGGAGRVVRRPVDFPRLAAGRLLL